VARGSAADRSAPRLEDQWSDFLLRRLDPYAFTKYDILLDWLGDVRGLTAMVVGSGSGEFAALLAARGADVTATDVDEASVRLTLETASRYGVRVAAKVARLEALHASRDAAGAFDVVCATDVIEHIADDVAAVRHLCALASPGGRVVVTVPAGPRLFGLHDEVLGHHRRYTRDALVRLFSPRLRIERLRPYGLLLIPVAFALSRVLRRSYPVAAVGEAEAGGGIRGALVRAFFRWERRVEPPAGISLLLLGRVAS
jgi:SAM-dependent methyltransferase